MRLSARSVFLPMIPWRMSQRRMRMCDRGHTAGAVAISPTTVAGTLHAIRRGHERHEERFETGMVLSWRHFENNLIVTIRKPTVTALE